MTSGFLIRQSAVITSYYNILHSFVATMLHPRPAQSTSVGNPNSPPQPAVPRPREANGWQSYVDPRTCGIRTEGGGMKTGADWSSPRGF
jgi:hypothetical protein